MKLQELLARIAHSAPDPHSLGGDIEVSGLCTNSHACQPGDLFIGLPGARVDGGNFWQSAIAAGAAAALIAPAAAQRHPPQPGDRVFVIDNIGTACADVAAAFYGDPARELTLAGVTGTNGKTTTSHLVEHLLRQAQRPSALLGTLGARWPGREQANAHTTPFAIELQRQLREALAAGSQYAVLEVSSHGLAQGRIRNCQFEAAAFTNLSQDHLDFHDSMEDYFQAKAMLFGPDYLQGRAIINQDDPYGQRLIASLPPERVWRYSLHDASAELRASQLRYAPSGIDGLLHTPVGETRFQSPLVGEYNLANLLAAVGVALHLDLDLATVAAGLARFSGVPGRMERVQLDGEQDISVVVDYAHTPDSLASVLRAARPFFAGRTLCVFGCGGDRDRGKRLLMGQTAAELADVAFVTSDNPRTEDPDGILQDILQGMPADGRVRTIRDRAEAIRAAVREAQPGDGILIAGKGHEDYQILGTEKVHFDDREQAREALQARLGQPAP